MPIFLMLIFFFIICVISSIYYSRGGDEEKNKDDGGCFGTSDMLKWRIKDVYMNDYEVFRNMFCIYLNKAAKVDKDVLRTFVKNAGKWDDRKLLEYIIHKSPKIEEHASRYSWKVNKTGDDIVSKLRRLSGDNVGGLTSYLDIGALATGHMDVISKELSIPIDRCFGINIDSGDKSALKYGQKDSEKIVIYNGFDIPDIIGSPFDLVTIVSVMHHIPPDILEKLVKSIAANCRKYLLIKENDLIDQKSKTYFIWQHLVFWRSTKMKSYTRCDLTSKKLKEMFEPLGFKLIGVDGLAVMTNACWHLFEKIENIEVNDA